MSPKLKNVKGTYDLKGEALATSVEVQLADDLKFKSTHKQDVGVVSAELEGNQWKATYLPPTKDLTLQAERKYKGYKCKVTQVVPGMNWSVIPSPQLEVETQVLNRDNMTDELELKYDMRTRKASVEEKIKLNSKHEFVWTADSQTGIQGSAYAWKTKFDRKGVKSLSAKYSKKTGPILKYEVDPTEKLEVKVEAALEAQALKSEIKYKPEQHIAELGVVLSHSLKDKSNKPNASVFVKWNF